MPFYDRLRFAARLSALAPLFLIGLPLQMLAHKVHAPTARHLPRHFHRAVCRVLGIRRTLVGDLLGNEPMLVVSNHVSWLDIVVLSAIMPVSFIAKSEVSGWPFVKSLARAQRTIFVDRTRRRATGPANGEIAARLSTGDAVVLFAEGTTSDGNRILPYRSALLGAAGEGSVSVRPVALVYSGLGGLPMTRRQSPSVAWYGDMDLVPHLKALLSGPPVDVSVHIGPPLRLAAAMDRKRVAQEAEAFARAARTLLRHPHHVEFEHSAKPP